MITLKKSVVVFDVDGTLLSSFPLIYKCLSTVISHYPNKVLDIDDLSSYNGPDEKGMLANMLKDRTLADKAFKEYLQEYKRLHAQYIPAPIAGIGELLRELRARRTLRLGIVSGRSKESLDISLEALHLRRFFENIQAGSPKGVIKGESMKRLIADFDVSKGEVIYIGDTVADIKSMQALNIPLISVWYDHPESVDELSALNPQMGVGSVAQLRALLLKFIR